MIKRGDLTNEMLNATLNDGLGEDQILLLSQALSSELRIQILKKINEGPITIPELAAMFNTSLSTMVYNCEMLEKAALIEINLMPCKTGHVRTCYFLMKSAHIKLREEQSQKSKRIYKSSCGVGEYIDCDDQYCINFVTNQEAFISRPKFAFSKERYSAGLVYSRGGYLTYAFPNEFDNSKEASEITIKLEICSEALLYDNEFPSDLTFWINDVELLTWTCPGDFGGRQGTLSPKWWSSNLSNTQYGMLVTIKIDKKGVHFNETLTNSKVTIDDLNLNKFNRIKFKVGNKEDAVNKGGFNIFGKTFGDYPIDIELEVITPFDE